MGQIRRYGQVKLKERSEIGSGDYTQKCNWNLTFVWIWWIYISCLSLKQFSWQFCAKRLDTFYFILSFYVKYVYHSCVCMHLYIFVGTKWQLRIKCHMFILERNKQRKFGWSGIRMQDLWVTSLVSLYNV